MLTQKIPLIIISKSIKNVYTSTGNFPLRSSFLIATQCHFHLFELRKLLKHENDYRNRSSSSLQMNGKKRQTFFTEKKARVALNEISTPTPSHFHPLDLRAQKKKNFCWIIFPPTFFFRKEYLISLDSSLPFAIIHKIKKKCSEEARPESLRHLRRGEGRMRRG